jgi:hypothetical protein
MGIWRAVLLLLLLWRTPAHAQLFDSIALFLQEPPRIVAKLDVRGGFISNRNVRFVGIKVGVEHARRFQYGIGYGLLYPSESRIAVVDGGEVEATLRMGYAAPYVDYAFYQRGPWEARLPVQLGFGAGSLTYRDADGQRRTIARSGLILYEPAMTVQYRFLRYFGVGAGWGFRLVIQTGQDLGERLTAPIYLFGLRVFVGDMWRDARGAGE